VAKPAAKKTAPAAYRRWTFGALSLALPAAWLKEPPSKALFSAYDPAVSNPRSGIAVVLAEGRNGRSFDQWAKDLAKAMQAAGAVGTVKATVVTEPSGKAVWVTGYRASTQGPLNTTQVVFDGGTVAYDVVLIAPQSKDGKYLPILRHAAQTFSRG
jgi:hypothetical protein